LKRNEVVCVEQLIAGCPTHSCLWNEWEPLDVGPSTFVLERHGSDDSRPPTHSNTANVWGTQPQLRGENSRTADLVQGI